MAVGESNQYLIKSEGGQEEITEEGRAVLERVVTDIDGDVYAFTGEMSQISIAAAMARLSHSPNDMRVILLDEFVGQEGKDDKFIEKIVSGFGDDSVAQLMSPHLVVEGASNLLTKQLERGRLAAYLEQSTRYVPYDEVGRDGHYKYLRPEFEPGVGGFYEVTMDRIFETYSSMLKQLIEHVQLHSSVPEAERDGAWRRACRGQALDAVRLVLPASTRSTVGIHGSAMAIDNMVMRLLSEETREARTTGTQILDQVRKVAPAFFERTDRLDRGAATTAYRALNRSVMRAMAERYLEGTGKADRYEHAKLIGASFDDELELVPFMLFEGGVLPVEEIRRQMAEWPIEDQLNVFEAYMGERLNRRHRPGRALERLVMSFDVVSDYGIFRDLQRHRMVSGMEWQRLSPYYGYEVPQLVIDAGLEGAFRRCFDLSGVLYEDLLNKGHVAEAQYATLLGHRMRWGFDMNAREAFHMFELRTAPGGHPGYRRLCNEMFRQVAGKFPNLAAAMRFVNQGEDPELTRLASERAAADRLQRLQIGS